MSAILHKEIIRHQVAQQQTLNDVLTIEEPLEIRVKYHVRHGVWKTMSLAVTMRTPGDDAALAMGFLFTESIINARSEVETVHALEDNIVLATLAETVNFDAEGLKRNFYTTSSCGVCGKASIESIHSDTIFLPWSSPFTITKSKLFELPERLRNAQKQFGQTGGIHACALIDQDGVVSIVKEDVGRHNAMDKLIGSYGSYPINDHLVLVSGRASFELVQKASKAGIPMLVAIGAPSSLAVQLAEEQGMGLVGFLRSGSFNVYTGAKRIV